MLQPVGIVSPLISPYSQDSARAEGEAVPTYIANDVSINQFDTECLCRIDSRVHAGQDEVLLRWWKGEVTLGET